MNIEEKRNQALSDLQEVMAKHKMTIEIPDPTDAKDEIWIYSGDDLILESLSLIHPDGLTLTLDRDF